jgi:hypothetical protein
LCISIKYHNSVPPTIIRYIIIKIALNMPSSSAGYVGSDETNIDIKSEITVDKIGAKK